MCALISHDAMQVKFLLQLSIVVSLYLNCVIRKDGVESKGKCEYLRVRWILEIGTSYYGGMVNGNVNSRKPRNGKAG